MALLLNIFIYRLIGHLIGHLRRTILLTVSAGAARRFRRCRLLSYIATSIRAVAVVIADGTYSLFRKDFRLCSIPTHY